MSDDKTSEIMRDALLAEKEVPVTEEEVEDYLHSGMLTPSGARVLQEGRAQFAAMALKELHPEPVCNVRHDQTFGQWLKETREKAGLSAEMVAAALGKEWEEIKEIEGGTVAPDRWLNEQDAANLSELFRIHFDALLRLVEKSSYTEEPWWYKALLYPDSDNTTGWAGDKSPPRSYPSSADVHMYHWLNNLRKELEKRRATHLLEHPLS